MPLLGLSVDYTDRDFLALLARAKSLIVSVFPNWTDPQIANFANLLVELCCFMGDRLGFYQDNQAAEAFIPTCQQRRNMLALCKGLGYVPPGPSAAEADVVFSLAAPVPQGRTVTLNPPFQAASNPVTCTTQDVETPQAFELVSQVVIAAGQSSGTGTVKNSAKQQESFQSNGKPSQSLVLAGTPFLDGSAVVVDGASAGWTEKANFLNSTSIDYHFVVAVDENDQATVKFGNGVMGAIPSGSTTITYETGGGLAGNVPAGTVTKLDGSFYDSDGGSVTVSVTNPLAADGGDDRQSMESIRELAPRSLRTNERCIARDDYEINARRVPGIKRALMLTRNEDRLTNAANAGSLYVVPTDSRNPWIPPGFPTQPKRDEVKQYLATNYPWDLTLDLTVRAPVYVDIGIQAVVYLTRAAKATSAATAAVVNSIVAAVQAFFALDSADGGTMNANVDFGQNLLDNSASAAPKIELSRLQALVQGVQGLREVGDAVSSFLLCAYRVFDFTNGYTDGTSPAEQVQSFEHVDVPLDVKDFPRLKASTWGSAVPHIVLLDGDNGNNQLYPPVS